MAAIHPIRPLGPLHWILDRLPQSLNWTVAASLSAEDRCPSTSQEVLRRYKGARCRLLKLAPHQRGQDVAKIREKIADHEKSLKGEFGGRVEVHGEYAVHSTDHEILEAVQQITDHCTENVVMDMSVMPKRWLFPLLQSLADAADVKTLIVTNTKPACYGRQLAFDADSWEPLPGYLHVDGNGSDTTAIIAVGYHTLNLHDFIGENPSRKIALKLFLPFPSLHPGFRRNWEFIREVIYAWKGPDRPEIVRIPIDDVSIAYDRLKQHTGNGLCPSLILAPFGPKPLSLAMCLLGIARGRNGGTGTQTEIGYTQPRFYAADYSSGVAKRDGIPEVNAYCVLLNGRELYLL